MNNMIHFQGGFQFINLSEKVTELDQVVCHAKKQVFFKSILKRLRLGWMTEQYEARLRVITLEDDNYTQKEIKYLPEGALRLYTTHQQQRVQ
jgi:hypothetical protein